MPSGITGATIVQINNGQTANAPDVMSSLNSLKTNGVNNDSGNIVTNGSGILTAVGFNKGSNVMNSTIFLGTPYHLTTNPTVNANATTNLTCTGGATGVPPGALGVLLQVGLYSASAQGGTIQIYPTGATAGIYANFTAAGPQNTYCITTVTVPLSAGGQITAKASGANIVLQDWYIYGYII